MSADGVPTRSALRAHLIESRIAGEVATSRENNLRHYGRMSDREPHYLFGLEPAGSWTRAEVLDLMARRCGVSPDPEHQEGQDTIDPDRTIDQLEAMAEHIGAAARSRARVLVATGHPVGMRPTHTAVFAAMAAAGCTMLTPAKGWEHLTDEWDGLGKLGYDEGVAIFRNLAGVPKHTHSPLLMDAALSELRLAGEAPPDLVVADHGWAGAAGQAGIETVGFADSNDPALFVGEAEGVVAVTVPLDDNVLPHLYGPMTAYLLHAAGLSLPNLPAHR